MMNKMVMMGWVKSAHVEIKVEGLQGHVTRPDSCESFYRFPILGLQCLGCRKLIVIAVHPTNDTETLFSASTKDLSPKPIPTI